MVSEHSPGRAGLRRFVCLIALALGLLAVAPASGLANPITTENALTGTSGWEVTQADTPNIDGYSNKTSIAPGESIGFSVSTSPTASYRIRIFRLGWYNGAGARLIGCLGSSFQTAPTCSTTSTGSARATPNPNAQTGEIDASNNNGAANWPVTNTVPAASTTNWTTGEYVAEYTLTSGSQTGNARYSPFVVRSNAPQASASSILVVVPFNTYDAYNEWGKTSAYVNTTNGSIFPLSNDHAYKVSFNRPFSRREWRFWDINLLRFLEKEGYDVSYVSDTDVDADPSILQKHRAVIVSGHSEYWTKNMRDGFDAARDAGTNLFFAGANDAYWQVRYEDSSCADDNTICGNVGDRRTMVIYKGPNEGPDDPMPGTANDTSKFRELGRPECELQGGVQYGSWFPNDGYRDYTTTAAGAADPWAAGSGLSNGSTISGLVGFEYDSFLPDCDVPGTPQILFAYQGPENPDEFDSAAVKYTADGSGARVFSSGSEQWAWGLDSYRWDPTLFTAIPPTNPAVQTFTRNMLTDMQKPASPGGLTATSGGGSIQIDTAPRTDPRITGYKVYRHVGTGSFQPGDSGVTLACQNTTGDCTDTPTPGTYRYAAVATDQWNDSSAALSASVSNVSPPTAVNDSATVSEDAVATAIAVTSNDTNPSGDPITISSASDPAHGTVVLTGGTPGANTGLTYQPDPNYCNNPPGTTLDTFDYTINGGSSATVSMTVACVDDAPVAVHDSKSVIEDDPATAVDVLANDTDIDGGTKSVASVTQPAHGQVVITGGGTGLTYKPNANYCNFPGPTSDDFTYTLNGGSSTSVSMSVDCRDDPPVPVNDPKTVTEDDPATAIDVLDNDTDVEGDPITISSASTPAHGTVVLTGGTAGARTGLSYKPNADYCNNPPGTTLETFTYTVNGGGTATVSVTVNCVNDPSIAVHDSKSVIEDDPATAVDVLSNDTDVEGDPITVTSVTQPTHGTVVRNSDGSGLTYKPNANYCNFPGVLPSDDFTYTINGGSVSTVSMTVDCVDDPPVANNDSATVTEDAAATAVSVLSNDTDVEGDPIMIASKTDPAHGTVAITGGGTGLTYKPNANYCNNPPGTSPDTFTYTVNGNSPNKTATVSMTVNCVDDPSVAINDSKSVTEDDPATAVDVLANDTDVDGGTKSIDSVTQPAHGQVVITGGGTGLTYKPNANYCNFPGGHPTDDFTYTLNGGSIGTVSMTVDCVNDPPDAVDDSATVTEDAAATSIDVLDNDTDVEGDAVAITARTQATDGNVVITGGGTGLTYRPNANYCGPDSFTYTVNGGDTATVSVTVTCVDDQPVAVADSTTVSGNSGANTIDALANDTDIDAGPKTVASFTSPSHGSVAGTGGSANAWTGLTYQPTNGYCGPDSFTYTLNGGSSATVSITVDCSGDPIAVDDAKTVTEDDPATAIDVLGNDTDSDGGAITVSSSTQPTNGTVLLTGGTAGARTGITYKPNANYCNNPPGTNLDTFQYTVNGGDTATVSVTVDCVDDAPVAKDDTPSGTEDSSSNSLNVLSNDTDVDGGTKVITSFTDPSHGSVAGSGGSANAWTGLSYTPDPNYCNDGSPTDGFTYTLNGGGTATVSVTVDCVDDEPVAHDDSATLTEDADATVVPVLANDTDVDGGPKTINSVDTTGTHGTVTITGGGAGLTYKPNANYCNTPSAPVDTFTYTLNGGSSATLSMTVTCVDDPPNAVNDSAHLTEDDPATQIDVLGNDTDVEGDPITVTAVGAAGHGTVVRNSDGSGLSYQPDLNYCNTQSSGVPDNFTYTTNGGNSATVSVTVDCVDDPPVAVDDSRTVSGNSGATPIPVLSNDTDVDGGGAKKITSVSDPDHGTVAITDGGTGLSYKPDAGYCSPPSTTDDFTYTLIDGPTAAQTATVKVTVDCSQPPNAVNDNATVPQDATATAVPVLANDTDVDGGAPMQVLSRTQPANGKVVITGAGTGLTYQPNSGYCNSTTGAFDTFTYTLNGGDSATVFMTVTCAAAAQQIVPTPPPAATGKKCKEGFKKVKGKCKKKKKKRKRK
jgi:Bacterial Ig domain/Bacterial cadherin-like domain